MGFPGGSEVKASACNVGDLGLIPGSGRSPGEGNGNPLQYSCLENPMDGGAWWATVHGVAKSWTRLSDFTFTLTWKNFIIQWILLVLVPWISGGICCQATQEGAQSRSSPRQSPGWLWVLMGWRCLLHCAPSLSSLLGLWAGKVGCCCSEPRPGFRKEKRVHFGLNLVRRAACELCELCGDKRTSRWDVAGVGVTEFPGSVRHGAGKLPSGLEWRLRCVGKKE